MLLLNNVYLNIIWSNLVVKVNIFFLSISCFVLFYRLVGFIIDVNY